MSAPVLLSFEDLKSAKNIDFCRAHIWRMVSGGKFPQPVRLGTNRIRWVESEIDAWIEERIADRDRQLVGA
jgi:prophage regulatory protein